MAVMAAATMAFSLRPLASFSSFRQQLLLLHCCHCCYDCYCCYCYCCYCWCCCYSTAAAATTWSGSLNVPTTELLGVHGRARGTGSALDRGNLHLPPLSPETPHPPPLSSSSSSPHLQIKFLDSSDSQQLVILIRRPTAGGRPPLLLLRLFLLLGLLLWFAYKPRGPLESHKK